MLRVVFAILLASCFAISAADPPQDRIWGGITGHEMPYYFSGTNSRIYMTVGPVYDSIKRVEMKIGGELVWSIDLPDPLLTNAWIIGTWHGVMFDSTRWSNGTNLEVKVEVWGWGATHRFFTNNAQVINNASLYGRYDLEIRYLNVDSTTGEWLTAPDEDETPIRSLPSSRTRLPDMGYYIYADETTLGWNALEFADDLMECNVLHLHTHGNNQVLWSDSNDYWYLFMNGPPGGLQTNIYSPGLPANYPTDSIAIQDYRYLANGTGLPPFNSTGKPPIHLAMFDACSTGISNDFAEGVLYPFGNAYVGTSSFPENQSSVGYATEFEVFETRVVQEAFWEHLEDTYTVSEARNAAFDAYGGSNKPSVATDLIRVWGDFFTRLKGVYTGAGGLAPGWHT